MLFPNPAHPVYPVGNNCDKSLRGISAKVGIKFTADPGFAKGYAEARAQRRKETVRSSVF
jgi:hypothetical protein